MRQKVCEYSKRELVKEVCILITLAEYKGLYRSMCEKVRRKTAQKKPYPVGFAAAVVSVTWVAPITLKSRV